MESLHNQFILSRRVEPIARKGNDQNPRRNILKGVLQPVLPDKVKTVKGLGQLQVGVCVKSVNEFGSLVVQVALHAEFKFIILRGSEIPSELLLHSLIRKVSNMSHHPSDSQTVPRTFPLKIVSILPFLIRADGPASNLVKGNRLGVVARGGRNHQGSLDEFGKFNDPLQGLHPPHASSHDGMERLYAERIQQVLLSTHHVLDRQVRKIHAIRFARGLRILAGRPGRSLACPQAIRANHEKFFGINRLAWSHHMVPPTGMPVIH